MLHRNLTGAFAVCLLGCVAATAQQPMTVAKLTSFIRSSKRLNQPDTQVAEVLKSCRMTERLDDATIEELQSLGAGPKTVQALKLLGQRSAGLGAAKPEEAEARPQKLLPPSVTEQGRVLQQVREYAINYSGSLPDFICTETTTRSEAPAHAIGGGSGFHKVDTLTAKLTYFQQHEEYKLKMHNDAIVTDDKQKFGGSSSYGDFGTMMKLLFEPSTEARFEWDDWGTLDGRRVLKFSYHIARDRSNYHLTTGEHGEQDIVTAYSGVVKIDRETLKISQITMVAEDIPASFPIRAASTVLDYKDTDISGHTFMLPSNALVDMTVEGVLSRNEKRFWNYGKYSADSSISFDNPSPDTPPVKKKQ